MLFAVLPALACSPEPPAYEVWGVPDPLPANGVVYGGGPVAADGGPVLTIDGVRIPLTPFDGEPPFAALGGEALLPAGSGTLELVGQSDAVWPVEVVATVDTEPPAAPGVSVSHLSTLVALDFHGDPDIALWEVEIVADDDAGDPIVRYTGAPGLNVYLEDPGFCEASLIDTDGAYSVRVRGWDGARNVSPWSRPERLRAGSRGCSSVGRTGAWRAWWSFATRWVSRRR